MATAYPIMLSKGQKDLSRRAVLAGLSLATVPLGLPFPKPPVAATTADHLPHPVLALPFVCDTTAAARTAGAAPRHFWSVNPTGNYGADCKTGAHYAELAVTFMVQNQMHQLLQWAVFDMMTLTRRHSGIEVGFMSAFGRIATQAHAASEGVRP